MCEFIGVSRATYYECVRKLEEDDPNKERMDQVQNVYEASDKTYDYRRITIHIQQKMGIWINHKAVLRLTLAPDASAGMHKLAIRSPKMHKKREEIGAYYRYPNVLNRDFVATKPNQKWVTDVTYIRTQQGWAYLSTIKDLYDGFIAAHVFHLNNSTALVTQTLKQAKQKEKVTDGLMLHSNQRTQYTSRPYHVLVGEYNITSSMSRHSNCWDNAPMENFFRYLKEEYLWQFKQTTSKETGQFIDEYIYFYNYERIQLKAKQTPSPDETRCLSS